METDHKTEEQNCKPGIITATELLARISAICEEYGFTKMEDNEEDFDDEITLHVTMFPKSSGKDDSA